MRVIYSLIIMFFLVSSPAFGSTISGEIYDFSLKKIGNVLVEINTAPKQFFVSKNGSFSFDAPIGRYEIKAQHYDRGILISSSSENVTITENKDYIVDLILFPVLNEEEELIQDEIKVEDIENNEMPIMVIPIVLVVLSVLLFFLLRMNLEQKKKEENEKIQTSQVFEINNDTFDSDIKIIHSEPEIKKKHHEKEIYGDDILDKVEQIIKEEGGRTTQKDIRRKIPLSEAKISLMITELEEKGKIKKIKKGRGNVIILR